MAEYCNSEVILEEQELYLELTDILSTEHTSKVNIVSQYLTCCCWQDLLATGTLQQRGSKGQQLPPDSLFHTEPEREKQWTSVICYPSWTFHRKQKIKGRIFQKHGAKLEYFNLWNLWQKSSTNKIPPYVNWGMFKIRVKAMYNGHCQVLLGCWPELVSACAWCTDPGVWCEGRQQGHG